MIAVKLGLTFAGISSVALGVIHFPSVWKIVIPNWIGEINPLPLLIQRLINTVLVALGLSLIILGMITLIAEVDKGVNIWFWVLCCLFWLWRLLWQIVYFPISKFNVSKRLLILHTTLIVVFVINFIAYLVPIINFVRA